MCRVGWLLMTGVVTAIVALLAATIIGFLWQRKSGALRPTTGAQDAADAVDAADDGDAAGLGAQFASRLGERATLVQFSSAFCAPCRATRRVLAEVAAMVDGVAYVEIDAESRLDLVRRLGVLRTPTVLVLDGAGRIVRRGSGLPRKADVIAALGAAVPESSQGAR